MAFLMHEFLHFGRAFDVSVVVNLLSEKLLTADYNPSNDTCIKDFIRLLALNAAESAESAVS